jgi:hypothetical protein
MKSVNIDTTVEKPLKLAVRAGEVIKWKLQILNDAGVAMSGAAGTLEVSWRDEETVIQNSPEEIDLPGIHSFIPSFTGTHPI